MLAKDLTNNQVVYQKKKTQQGPSSKCHGFKNQDQAGLANPTWNNDCSWISESLLQSSQSTGDPHHKVKSSKF